MSDAPEPSQLENSKAAARDLGTDDDPMPFADTLGKLVKHKSVEKPE